MQKKILLFALSAFLVGLLKSDNQPYIIYRTPPGGGFWSNFMIVLAGLDEADRQKWVPVIDMERYKTHYNEKTPILNTLNAWEYCFEQPGKISLKTAIKLKAPNNKGGKQIFSRAITIRPPEEKIRRAKELIKKYIRIHKPILDELDALINAGLHDNILGVHVRGTDRRQGIYPNHLLTTEADSYFKKALDLDEIYHFSQVFLACDEIETVELFKHAFGNRIIVTDAFRVSTQTQTSTNYDWLFNATRQNHRYLLAREVLIDALLLSRCGHLLCGPSNVTQAAIYFAEDTQIIHEVASPGLSNSNSRTYKNTGLHRNSLYD